MDCMYKKKMDKKKGKELVDYKVDLEKDVTKTKGLLEKKWGM